MHDPRTNMRHLPAAHLRYALAFAAVGLAWAARAWLLPDSGDRSPFLAFGLAVLVTALGGGFGPGVLAVVLSSGVAVYHYLPPRLALAVHEPFDGVLLGLFVLEGLVAALAGGMFRRALGREAALDRSGRRLATFWQRAEIVRGEPPVYSERPVEDLTPREREVVRLLASGLSNDEIAASLFVSRNTIKTHLKHIYQKLEVRTRTEAVAHSIGLGLLQGEPGEDEVRLVIVGDDSRVHRSPEQPAA